MSTKKLYIKRNKNNKQLKNYQKNNNLCIAYTHSNKFWKKSHHIQIYQPILSWFSFFQFKKLIRSYGWYQKPISIL